jgi:hypothetical protein
MPSQAAIASGVLALWSRTRVPGSMRSAAAIASERVLSSS